MAVEEAVAWVAALGARGKAGPVLSARCQQLRELQARLSGRQRWVAHTRAHACWRTPTHALARTQARARSHSGHFGHAGPTRAAAAAPSAPGLGSPLPHLHRDWAHRCHICTGTELTPATSAPGLRLTPATSAPDWACRRWPEQPQRRLRVQADTTEQQQALEAELRCKTAQLSALSEQAGRAPRAPDEALPAGRRVCRRRRWPMDECRACRSSHPKRSGYAARS
jgi:hypothetical protein